MWHDCIFFSTLYWQLQLSEWKVLGVALLKLQIATVNFPLRADWYCRVWFVLKSWRIVIARGLFQNAAWLLAWRRSQFVTELGSHLCNNHLSIPARSWSALKVFFAHYGLSSSLLRSEKFLSTRVSDVAFGLKFYLPYLCTPHNNHFQLVWLVWLGIYLNV